VGYSSGLEGEVAKPNRVSVSGEPAFIKVRKKCFTVLGKWMVFVKYNKTALKTFIQRNHT